MVKNSGMSSGFGDIGDALERSGRTVMTRDYEMDKDFMSRHRLNYVQNAAFSNDTSGNQQVGIFINDCYHAGVKNGEVCIIDRCTKVAGEHGQEIILCSAMFFGDIYSWHVFAIRHYGWFWDVDKSGLATLLN